MSNHTSFAPGKNVKEVEEKRLKVVQKEFKADVHHWLLLHGRYVCTAKKQNAARVLLKTYVSLKVKRSSFNHLKAIITILLTFLIIV